MRLFNYFSKNRGLVKNHLILSNQKSSTHQRFHSATFCHKPVMVGQPDAGWLRCLLLVSLYDSYIKMQRISGCPSRALLFSNLKTKWTFASKLSKLLAEPPASASAPLSLSPIPCTQQTQFPYC